MVAPVAHVRCPQCNTVVEKPAVGDPVCPNCGFGAPPAARTSAKKAAKTATASAAAPPPPPPGWAPAPSGPPMMSPPAFSDPGAPVPVNSGKAVAAMVVGIVACCLPFVIPIIGPFLGLPLGIAALVLGILANKECNAEPARIKGKGMAITGIVLGSIMIVMGLLLIIAFTIGVQILEDALCEDDPDSEECQEFRDRTATPGSQPWITGLDVLGSMARPLRLTPGPAPQWT